jgi:hypothetical protein
VSTGADNEFSDGLVAPGGAQPGVLYYQAERAIVAGLRHGWAYLRDNIDQLDNITRYSDEVERAAMRDLFTRDRGQYLDPNKITVGYPFIDAGAPQLCAMVESETGAPNGAFIGDNIGGLMFPGVVTAGGPGRGLQKASLRVRTVAIMMASPHPDVVTYLDAIVDAIMYGLDFWFMRPGVDGGAGLVAVEQGNKTEIGVDPRSEQTANRLWIMTSRWHVTGHAGTSLAIPPPKTRVLVRTADTTVAGLQGRVTVGGR